MCMWWAQPEARSAKKMSPAQVPQMGRPSAAKLLSSGIRPHRSAMSAIVVLSPVPQQDTFMTIRTKQACHVG